MITKNSSRVTIATDEAVVDGSLLGTIVRRRRWSWAFLGAGLFVTFLLGGLFLVPQSYTASVSIAMDQSSNTPSALAALTGMSGGGGKKYVGVLRSRLFASEVEQAEDVHDIYGISPDDAVDKIMKGIKVEDNALDGLMYVSVTLDAPARLAPDPTGMRYKIRQATARVANRYILALRHYMKNSDSDKGLSLLRQADQIVTRLQRETDQAQMDLRDFVYSLGTTSNTASHQGGIKPGPETPMVVAHLTSLYAARADLLQQQRADEASIAETNRLITGNKLDSIPQDDPILAQARSRVNNDQIYLDNLKVRLGDENPQVVNARKQLENAQKILQTEVDNTLKGNTSAHVRLQSHQARLDRVNQQIADTESKLQLSREDALQLDYLKAKAESSRHVLEQTLVQHAQLKLQTASAESRMTPIDLARAPQHSAPRLLMIVITSLIGAAAVVFLWLALEYLIRAQKTFRLAEV